MCACSAQIVENATSLARHEDAHVRPWKPRVAILDAFCNLMTVRAVQQ